MRISGLFQCRGRDICSSLYQHQRGSVWVWILLSQFAKRHWSSIMTPGWKAARAQSVVYGAAAPPRSHKGWGKTKWAMNPERPRRPLNLKGVMLFFLFLFISLFIYLFIFLPLCDIHCNGTTAEMPGLCGAAESSEVATVRETASTLTRPFDFYFPFFFFIYCFSRCSGKYDLGQKIQMSSISTCGRRWLRPLGANAWFFPIMPSSSLLIWLIPDPDDAAGRRFTAVTCWRKMGFE